MFTVRRDSFTGYCIYEQVYCLLTFGQVYCLLYLRTGPSFTEPMDSFTVLTDRSIVYCAYRYAYCLLYLWTDLLFTLGLLTDRYIAYCTYGHVYCTYGQANRPIVYHTTAILVCHIDTTPMDPTACIE